MTLNEVFQELRKANHPVPKPLRLPTLAEVEAAERDIGVPFHPDYRRFQLEVSDVVFGVLEPALVLPGLMPCLDLRKAVRAARQIGVPAEVLPFCENNGDYFFIDCHGGVGYWDHNGGGGTMLYKSLADWIAHEWLGIEKE
jgi:hypothetical protein